MSLSYNWYVAVCWFILYTVMLLTPFCKLLSTVAILSGETCRKCTNGKAPLIASCRWTQDFTRREFAEEDPGIFKRGRDRGLVWDKSPGVGASIRCGKWSAMLHRNFRRGIRDEPIHSLKYTKLCQLIIGIIIKIIAIICHILRSKCTKFDSGWGSAPVPAGRAYSASPDP